MGFEDIFNTSVGKVLDFLITFHDYDYNKADIARNAEVSYKTLHNIWPILENQGFVKYTRTIGKSKMYKLNKDNELVKHLRKIHIRMTFDILDEYKRKNTKKIRAMS